MSNYKRWNYIQLMNVLTMTVNEYEQAKRAFQGGFTHGNPWYVDRVMYDVLSMDFTSSYPAVMVAEQFPMSRGELVKLTSTKQFYDNIKMYCCLFDVEFTDLKSTVTFENYISRSRCWSCENEQLSNGRVVRADMIRTTITEQDFLIIRRMYTWKTCRIGNFYRYMKGYLPTDFVRAILKLYGDKTTLKGVAGKEAEYLEAKEELNSCYGMSVTDPVRDKIVYKNDEWVESDSGADVEKCIQDYNTDTSRFLSYLWGVWVTAYARRNLFSGILECGSDYIYADTDSIKIINADKHNEYFNRYNTMIIRQLKRACEYHKINPALIEPMTIKGAKKPLGVWDFDGLYSRFKTLGAKRYMVEYADDERNHEEDRGKISFTVSGLNKHVGVPYICTDWYYDRDHNEHNSPFDKFTDQLYVPPEYTGKMTHTYIDEEMHGTVVDYLGKPFEFYAPSAVHLENAEYSMSIAQEFMDYINDLREEYY